MTDHRCSRRRFLVHVAVAASTAPVLRRLTTQEAQAALTRLPTTNAQAKALNYSEDASKVKHAMYKPGSTCANCQFFTPGTGACTIFQGFSVAPAGWCTAWAKKV